MFPSDADLREVLASSHTIAVVGHSDKSHRSSYGVARYLRRAGYRVYAVNPTITAVDGDLAYPSLASLPEPIDIVNVFRRSEFLPQIVEDAITIHARAVWSQLGVTHPPAEARARQAGLLAVSDLCIAVEHRRLGIPPRA